MDGETRRKAGHPTRNVREAAMDSLRTLAVIACGLAAGVLPPPPSARANDAPRFMVDPFWPKPLPGNQILGQVANVAVDRNDHIWIVHRPASLVDDEKGATQNPPTTKCCTAPPPVL